MQSPGDLESQLACKEREWKELQTLRIQQLETALSEATAQLSSQRERFLRLRDDFQYNLRVLEERDRELERYDAMAARAHTEEGARREEISELRIQVAKLQDALAEQTNLREDLQLQYQKREVEHRLQLESMQSAKDREIQRLREENETLKRDLQRRVQETEGEIALQKQEMKADFDDEMRRREHEFNLKMDEMRSEILSHELKVKLLNKELEAHAKGHSQVTEALRVSEELCQQAQRQIQQRQRDLRDMAALKDSRIKELEEQVSQTEAKQKREEEASHRKYAELERRVREKEAALGLQREAHAVELKEERNRTAELQAQIDKLLLERERLDQNHTNLLNRKEHQIEELRTQLQTTRAGWDAYITQVSKETVAKDTELLSAEEREAKVRAELQTYKEDVERYKQQLANSIEREKVLDQRRVQLELEWQRRCEDACAEHYLKSEELIQGLTQAREQVCAELREKERELQETVALLRSVTIERDQALQTARGRHAKDPQAGRVDSSGFPSEEIRRLQNQNTSLRAVVAEMRREMERLTRQIQSEQTVGHTQTPAQDTQEKPHPTGSTEYNLALEEELKELKAKCRCLEDQLEEASKTPDLAPPASVPSHPVAPDNAYLQNHIRSLNETVGGLRAERVASAAGLRKLEVRSAHLESCVAQLTQQCHSKQLESEGLRLELANQRRGWAAEEAGLRQRLAAVEMELEEVRREAEEYQKGSVLHNLETVALGNQVSALKLDIASRREPVVLQQSEMVKQLQEETLRLRQQLLSREGKGGVAPEVDAPLLQSKLRQAARMISRLSRDKQQLIEMGNRLRAQLAQTGLDDMKHSVSDSASEPCDAQMGLSKPLSDNQPGGRLSALERLQYQLTSQELQFAQRDERKRRAVIVRAGLSDNESGEPWDPPTRDHRSKENTPPALDQSGGITRLLSSSAGTDESLRDVWQMLDRGWSPSILTPSDHEARGEVEGTAPDSGAQVEVQGLKAAFQERKKPTKPLSEPVKKTRPPGNAVKIRNYNIKD
ncbi:coiled-coil domain-containing protein 57 [Chanos chanos]|uniref:Coiled-coil domain-containing protein 57 n=1 Tax=Chanos chanos TaxID=29144 RepID=A0A6J2VCZ3_CHACN|nr:coiled-coil domain-containing protein 57 [Chanos chanos]